MQRGGGKELRKVALWALEKTMKIKEKEFSFIERIFMVARHHKKK